MYTANDITELCHKASLINSTINLNSLSSIYNSFQTFTSKVLKPEVQSVRGYGLNKLTIGILICGRGGDIFSPLCLEGIFGNELKGGSSSLEYDRGD